MYQLFVGEIGFNRHEFLYDLKLWEIRCIIKGYRNRAHTQWESVRLGAFFVMSAMTDMRKAGIHRDTDLIKFPWETLRIETGDQPTPEQVQQLRELMRQENAKLEQKRNATDTKEKEKDD